MRIRLRMSKRKGKLMYQAGLVLEGGGMKGIYTAGALEYFLEQDLDFSAIYGVSAGACHMINFLAKQKGRMFAVSTDYLKDPHYCGWGSLIKSGDFFNVKMCYTDIPERLNPYDYETFDKYQGKAYSVVTNIVTGEPEYLQVKDVRTDIGMVRASASLPLVSRNVEIGDGLYLDGGISDAIPLRRSIADGNKKNLVIMTKEEGYIRQPAGKMTLAMLKAKYKKYPKVIELMESRHERYNELVREIEEKKASGEIFLLRPKHPSDVGRIEKDKEKMRVLYEEGYNDAKENFDALMKYLEK